jgi:transposase InsO family protein
VKARCKRTLALPTSTLRLPTASVAYRRSRAISPPKSHSSAIQSLFHIDIAEVRTEEGKLYLFVAIDRTSKFAFAHLHKAAKCQKRRGFLAGLDRSCALSDSHLADRQRRAVGDLPSRRDGPTARYRLHLFDRVCGEHCIEHRLTKPKHPWTNGQVERMNRTLKEATLRCYHTQETRSGHTSIQLQALVRRATVYLHRSDLSGHP